MKKLLSSTFVLLILATTVSCAPKNWNSDEDGAYDPLEEMNRNTYGINKKIDLVLLKPAATVYNDFPPLVQKGIGNFANNLEEPFNAINHLLQYNATDASKSIARFAFNSSFGIGGLIDIGDMMEIEEKDTDIGQTIRAYCQEESSYFKDFDIIDSDCKNGTAYIVLPILGPSSVTDITKPVLRSNYSPLNNLESGNARNAIKGVIGVHIRWEFSSKSALVEEAALDEYSFVRDAYEDYRKQNMPSTDNLWLK